MYDCILNPDKYCTECGQCNVCDLDPTKICDNCCQCLGDADYRAIEITEIQMPSKVKMKWKHKSGKSKGKAM